MVRRILYCGAAFIALVFSLSSISQSQVTQIEQKSPALSEISLAADFNDKIVLLEVNRSATAFETESGSLCIAKVRFAKFGNRDFIVGLGYELEGDSDSWYKDMMVGVPCESVVRFIAMREDQIAEYVKKWKEDEGEE